LTTFLLTHLFLTLISLPILVGWGLPLSLMAPVGNMLFSPILGVYLICAMALFFTELIGIPNGLCVWALEVVSSLWLSCLNVLQSSVHLGFVRPHFLFLCIIPCITCAIIWHCRTRSRSVTLAALSIWLCIVCTILYMLPRTADQFAVACGNTQVQCITAGGTVAIIDADNVLARRVTSAEWVIYHLIPAVTAHSSITRIDHFIMPHPRQRNFEAITLLCEHMPIRYVYLPYWQGKLKKSAWRAYMRMCDAVKATGGTVITLQDALRIPLSENIVLHCTKTAKSCMYHDSTYPIFTVESVDTIAHT
jgi:hypothetical protein